MIKSDPIQEQDILIGQYTLGLLSPQEAHRVQALLARDPAAARIALHWEERFLTLVDALPPAQASDALLDDILTALDLPAPAASDVTPSSTATPAVNTLTCDDRRSASPSGIPEGGSDKVFNDHMAADDPDPLPINAVGMQSVTVPVEPHRAIDTDTPAIETPEPAGGHKAKALERKQRSRRIWLGSAAAVTLVALLTLAFMPRQPAEPPIVIVEVAPSKGAVLQAPGQSSTPGWVVTIDLENNVTLTPQVHTDTPEGSSVQLWTYNRTLRRPRSLGLIDPNQPVAIPADLMGEIGDDQFFEMTLEPAGGSPNAEPSGPILFIGRVVTFS